MNGIPTRLRPLQESDHSFVISSWLCSTVAARQLSPIPQHVVFRELHPIIEHIIHAHPSWFRVACSEYDPGQILGWACIEPGAGPILHYLYVKRRFRGEGIARRLLDGLKRPLTCTHWTIHCEGRQDLLYEPSKFYERRKTA